VEGVLRAFEDIPDDCVLGLNYSGMHDTAVALVDRSGKLVRAVALERISRVKQDGRWPREILRSIPASKLKYVAVAVAERYAPPERDASRFLVEELTKPARFDRSHQPEFYSALSALEKEIVFVPHHLSHASSAFWASGYDEALAIVYDGGMSNEHWFGGVWRGSRRDGLSAIDLFSAARYANVAQLYAAVTGVLGFEPLRHEGKLTGLAAFGKVNDACLDVLRAWLVEPENHHELTYWRSPHGQAQTPKLCVDARVRDRLRACLGDASAADVAASLQHLVEEHVVALVGSVLATHPGVKRLCLSGGLFANVKINQRVSELGVDELFVFPAMADDGVSVGAAWQALFDREKVPGAPIDHVFLGPNLYAERQGLQAEGVRFSEPENLAKLVAERLARGEVGAIVRGRSEFGPRALCNRSILASAERKEVNDSLNKRLRRTEFMPFAPVVREEDADRYFTLPACARKAAEYMTITAPCLPVAIQQAPAVVHVDETARPQVASRERHGFAHEVLSEYERLTGCGLLVNTSFNIHEEPIVASVEDALRGFFEAGLDFLVLGELLVQREENLAVEASFLRRKIEKSEREARALQRALDQKTLEAQELAGATEAYRDLKARIDRVDRSLGVRIVALLRGYQGA
jgi:carbamoyltransferase